MFAQAFFRPLSLFLIFASDADLPDELRHRVMHKLGTQFSQHVRLAVLEGRFHRIPAAPRRGALLCFTNLPMPSDSLVCLITPPVERSLISILYRSAWAESSRGTAAP